MALAHTLSDKTAAACNRSDLFERGRRLMAAWGSSAPRPSRRRKRRADARGGSRAVADVI